MLDREGYRPNVGIILVNGRNEVFWGKRIREHSWQFPQGGIKHGESPEQAMYRELQEEIGLRQEHVRILGRTRDWLRYRLPEQFIRNNVHPLCIGQKQRWYLLRLTGAEAGLRFDTTTTPEFDRWRWTGFWEPVREVIFFKRQVYVQALNELGPRLFPAGLPPRPDWGHPGWSGAEHD